MAQNSNINNLNLKAVNERVLENDLNSLCTNENCQKIKKLLSELINLSCLIQKSFLQYINEKNPVDNNENSEESINNEILSNLEIQNSFLNVIYFESFNELPHSECSLENLSITKKDLVQKIFNYTNILSRLLILIDNQNHQKYIIEILIDMNKILTLILSGNLQDVTSE